MSRPGQTPFIASIATVAGTVAASLYVQRVPDPFPVIAEAILASAYIGAAFVIARQKGWRRALSIGCALSSPLWFIGLSVVFTAIGVLLGLNDEALPGETARQSFQDAARPALGLTLAIITLGVWIVVLTICTRNLWIGLGIAAVATAALLLPDAAYVPVLWHGSVCSLLMLWALRVRGGVISTQPGEPRTHEARSG